jgi:hypothetical protein
MDALMKPVVMRVPGEFWDTQIYSGRLYLFGIDGSITTLDWDRLTENFAVPEPLRLAFDCAFRYSHYLYGDRWASFFNDPEVVPLLLSKFARLREIPFDVTRLAFDRAILKTQDNPFPFPHADATVFDSVLYVGSRDGVYRSGIPKKRVYPVQRKAMRVWDGNVVGIAAAYRTLALAAGGDGLFQHNVERNFSGTGYPEPEHLSGLRCDRCAWAYWSIFASSYEVGGYLAEFRRSRQDDTSAGWDDDFGPVADVESSYSTIRTFDRFVAAEEIFGNTGFAWAGKDKLYNAARSELSVSRYDPFAEEDRRAGRRRSNRPTIRFAGGVGLNGLGDQTIFSAEVATFGTIVEGERDLIVFLSDGTRFEVPEGFARWRVFPRSRHYENHLHVLYDDHLAIYSFNQDYFVDQREKLFGMRVPA